MGFAAVADEIGDSVDFQADVFEARLGAKVGAEAMVALDVAESAALDAIK